MQQKRVGVIGAGLSGLVTAKVFLSQGHSVTLFEQSDTLGGVWAPSRRYPGLRIQIPRDCYAFTDYPMPQGYPEFPSGEQMYAYLEGYAKHFGIIEHIRTRTEVLRMVRRPGGSDGWRVEIRDLATGRETGEEFDFVVVCNGVFSTPALPKIPGREEFEANGGVFVHSSHVRDTTPLKDRDVVVVGFGKSAVDLAEAALAAARSCAIVCRRVIWKVPRRIWGRANAKYFIFTRFAEFWFPHPDMRGFRRFMHKRLRFLVEAYWRFSEGIILRQLGMTTPELRPDYRLSEAAGCVGFAPYDDFAMLHEGRLRLHRGEPVRLTADGIVLDDGRTVPAQTIVLATGYRRDFTFLGEEERAQLLAPDGAMRLYRLLVNPDIPFMGFNGYNGYTTCQLSSEVGACWLAELMAGRVKTPDRAAMYASIEEENVLRRRLLSVKHGVGFYATPFAFGYLDRLLADLGLPPADRKKSLRDWLFVPIDPRDYQNLLERANKRGTGNPVGPSPTA